MHAIVQKEGIVEGWKRNENEESCVELCVYVNIKRVLNITTDDASLTGRKNKKKVIL